MTLILLALCASMGLLLAVGFWLFRPSSGGQSFESYLEEEAEEDET